MRLTLYEDRLAEHDLRRDDITRIQQAPLNPLR